MNQPIQQAVPGSAVQPQPKKKVGKILLFIFLGLVTFGVIMFAIVNMAAVAPVAVSDKFIEYIQEGEAEEAYALFYDDRGTSLKDFTSIVNRVGPLLTGEPKITGKAIGASTDKGKTATITYKIPTDGELAALITIKLLKNAEDEWKVVSFVSEEVAP